MSGYFFKGNFRDPFVPIWPGQVHVLWYGYCGGVLNLDDNVTLGTEDRPRFLLIFYTTQSIIEIFASHTDFDIPIKGSFMKF